MTLNVESGEAMFHKHALVQCCCLAVCCTFVDLWRLIAELIMSAGKAHGCCTLSLDLR